MDELKTWKSIQSQRLAKLTDSTDDLQIFQFSGEPMTAPNVSNFRAAFKKRLPEDFKLIRNHDFRHSHVAFFDKSGIEERRKERIISFSLL